MHMPVQIQATESTIEGFVSTYLQAETRLKQVELHITDAKRLIERIRQQLADFKLPQG